jgi:cysteine desulfurase/selenocysteine lyase
VSELADLAHANDALCFIDGAQAVPNRPVDVEAIDADFYAFSGHKMAGPTGIGVLYGKQHLLESMEPFGYGGEMIRKVTFEDSTWNDLPWKYEPGTPVIAQGVGLHAAIDFLEDIGMDAIRRHEEALAAATYRELAAFDDVEIYGPPAEERAGLVSFNLDGVHAHDLSSICNEHGVAIRAGDHCTQPLHDRLGVAASARASFFCYNRQSEIDQLVDAVNAARELFG